MAASITILDAFFVRKMIQYMATISRTAVVTFDMERMTIKRNCGDIMCGMEINYATCTEIRRPEKKVSILVNVRLVERYVSRSTSSVRFVLLDYGNREGQLFMDVGVDNGTVDIMDFLDEEPLHPHVFGFAHIKADIPTSVLKDILTEIVEEKPLEDHERIHISIGENDISFARVSADERKRIHPRSYVLEGDTGKGYEAVFEIEKLLHFVNIESPIFSIVSCSDLDRWNRNIAAVVIGYPKRYETGKSYLAGLPMSRDLLNQFSALMK